MPRIIEITTPPDKTDGLLSEIRELEGLIGLRCERGISISPVGDLVTVHVANRSKNRLMRVLDRHGVCGIEGSSVTMTEPTSVISASAFLRF